MVSAPGVCESRGFFTTGDLEKWTPPKLTEEQWLRNLAPAQTLCTNLDTAPTVSAMLACDLSALSRFRQPFVKPER